ncbi:MAG TPA: HTH domain-containing protein [Thermoanaerobaculia bacterium]
MTTVPSNNGLESAAPEGFLAAGLSEFRKTLVRETAELVAEMVSERLLVEIKALMSLSAIKSPVISLKDLAKAAGVTTRTIWRHIEEHHLPAPAKVGGKLILAGTGLDHVPWRLDMR